MSTSAVSACFALVKDMDRHVATLPTISAAAGKAAAEKLVSRARQLKDEPKLGRAEWKRLLVDKKARHHGTGRAAHSSMLFIHLSCSDCNLLIGSWLHATTAKNCSLFWVAYKLPKISTTVSASSLSSITHKGVILPCHLSDRALCRAGLHVKAQADRPLYIYYTVCCMRVLHGVDRIVGVAARFPGFRFN